MRSHVLVEGGQLYACITSGKCTDRADKAAALSIPQEQKALTDISDVTQMRIQEPLTTCHKNGNHTMIVRKIEHENN